jgi:2-polyprenyl-3-methyl-5-hydroxy-6-metoxy-1,4-benzoquinol methylase
MKTVSSRIYTKEYYLSSCRGFEEFLRGGVAERLIYASSLANLKKGMHVLDVGSGRGELVVLCARAGALAWGIDYSQEALKIAKESIRGVERGVAERINFKKMNAKKISHLDKSFDVVFMIDVVEHLYPEELKQALLEIKRVLKPGGKVIIHTPNVWLIKLINFLAKIFFKWEEYKVHVNEQSFFSLRRELRFFGGRMRIYLRPRRECFSEITRSVKSLPSWTINLAGFLDKLWENRIVSFMIYRTPLAVFLGTDLWAVIELSKEDKLLR